MYFQHPSPAQRPASPRPHTQRLRSNSLPIVDVLGCSTPEAKLLLAEGKAAVQTRRSRNRARRRRSRMMQRTESATTFDPRDHLQYLQHTPSVSQAPSQECELVHARSCHARIPSNTTDGSVSTVVPDKGRDTPTYLSPITPLGNYSATLAEFIKEQLRSIPTYQPAAGPTSPLSPRSCPDFSFEPQSPPISPRAVRRPTEAPRIIEIPPIRPPLISAFSAWSSTDDETDEEVAPLPAVESLTHGALERANRRAGFIQDINVKPFDPSSFLLSSTPLDEDEDPITAKAATFSNQATLLELESESHDSDVDHGYPSSSLSHPQLSTSSAPSYSSSLASAPSSSYFDCKRPASSITPQLKDRLLAALAPPSSHQKIIPAISPWEGAAIANIHDVFVESEQRVHVDGMTFDMLRDFHIPSRVTTPC